MRIGDLKIHAVDALEKEYNRVDESIKVLKYEVEDKQRSLKALEEKRKGITEALNLIQNNS